MAGITQKNLRFLLGVLYNFIALEISGLQEYCFLPNGRVAFQIGLVGSVQII